jgi:hypothetical protein
MQMNLMLETRRGGGFSETDRKPVNASNGGCGATRGACERYSEVMPSASGWARR